MREENRRQLSAFKVKVNKKRLKIKSRRKIETE